MLFCGFFVQLSAQITWTRVTTLPVTGRIGPQSFVIDSSYYIVGGGDSLVTILPEVWSYNLVSNVWIKKNSCDSVRITGGAGSSSGGYGYIFGGKDSMLYPSSLCWRYDAAHDSWSEIDSMPQRRAINSSFKAGSRIFSCCGEYVQFSNELLEYDVALDRWIMRSPIPGEGRDIAAVAATDSFGYVLGGRTYYGSLLNECWRYNVNQDSWDSLPPIPGLPRGEALVFSFRNFLLAGYGFDSLLRPLRDLYRLDFSTGIWSSVQVSGMTDSLVFAYNCYFQYDHKCYLYGGERGDYNSYRGLWMFDPAPLGPVFDTLSTGLQEPARDIQGLKLRPNPATASCTITVSAAEQRYSAQLYDLSGQAVGSQWSFTGAYTFSVAPYAPGVYLVRVSTADGYRSSRMLVVD
jgi:hypothetical protein